MIFGLQCVLISGSRHYYRLKNNHHAHKHSHTGHRHSFRLFCLANVSSLHRYDSRTVLKLSKGMFYTYTHIHTHAHAHAHLSYIVCLILGFVSVTLRLALLLLPLLLRACIYGFRFVFFIVFLPIQLKSNTTRSILYWLLLE